MFPLLHKESLTEISLALVPSSLTIYAPPKWNVLNIDLFLSVAHRMGLRTTIFTKANLYFAHIHRCQNEAIETTSLILASPLDIVSEIFARNHAHRLNLFMFFWNIKQTNFTKRDSNLRVVEPIRVVILTRPRRNCLKVHYNQATPDGRGLFTSVNWYDADDLGLSKVPLLPSPASVYRNFNGRVLSVPVIHSPPWNFVEYGNDTNVAGNASNVVVASVVDTPSVVRVVGGRDYNLLRLLSQKMNFNLEYIDPVERTQGAIVFDVTDEDNLTFSGGLGLIQRREADMLLGDVTITLERRKAVEFSFFTLSDSGAFATHAPKRLNEALVLVRPFRWEVWPLLLCTIFISGPAFYLIIAIPFWWQSDDEVSSESETIEIPFNRTTKQHNRKPTDWNPLFLYTLEMNYGIRDVEAFNRGIRDGHQHRHRRASLKMPDRLLEKCIWFTITIFLKQSCNEVYPGKRAKFVSTILWLATTYVLADVYSAQLTSQLARPAREPPINTLQQLETAMNTKGYQLFVERESSSFSALENGTEIFQRLFTLMQRQSGARYANDSHLVSTVEEGVSMILDGSTKVILGGRETLYFNMKRHGMQNFQLSEKLFTRYSAVAVQNGCPFVERLNKVLIRLFEGGIMEKMTNDEYELMINMSKNRTSQELTKSTDDQKNVQRVTVESKTKPINLRTLQGAFIVLAIGFSMAGIVLTVEMHVSSIHRSATILFTSTMHISAKIVDKCRSLCRPIIQLCKHYIPY